MNLVSSERLDSNLFSELVFLIWYVFPSIDRQAYIQLLARYILGQTKSKETKLSVLVK